MVLVIDSPRLVLVVQRPSATAIPENSKLDEGILDDFLQTARRRTSGRLGIACYDSSRTTTETIMNFEYRRQRGERRTYRVTAEITGRPGEFRYKASIYYGNDFKGTGIPMDLTATDLDSAMMEARENIEQDIEDLAGVDE
jgi:hypothetical protein